MAREAYIPRHSGTRSVTVRDEYGGPRKVNRGRRHTGHGARGTLHWGIYDRWCGVPVCSMSMCCGVVSDRLSTKKREVSENYVRWGRHVPVPAAGVTCPGSRKSTSSSTEQEGKE